ncbi:putative Legumain [Rhodotorula taiwanensis]|uniref:Putative Legumain n=1 Tax=Rhodotorula taiwanensis TaxID=741276 RepID=A0A2S5BDI2_9BASI|nr:putative Legumain [Rhodotorula taiwanensis]
MQSLVGYGSDSDDESRPQQPVAGPSSLTGAAVAYAVEDAPSDRRTAPPAPQPALTRIKGAASARSNSPLSGVRLPTSTGNSPRSGPSAASLGKRRESSASPPPFARADAGRTERNGSESSPAPSAAGSSGPAAYLNTLAEFGIPPIPTGPCAPSVQAKLANFHNLRLSRGLHFNDSLHASKAFRNPRIYAKLVEFVDVDESGSNWDPEIWNAREIGPDATASRIAELQKIRSEAKQTGASQRSSIAFAPSTTSTSASSRAADDPRQAGLSRRADDGRGEREYRPRDRDREKDWDRGGDGKRSRWDRGGRDRSRSPRRK